MYKQTLTILNRCAIQYTNYFRIVESRNMRRWVAPTLKELYRRRERVGPEPEKPRSSYLEWNYDAELFAFGKRLGENIDKNLLKQALIQKEYANLLEIQAKENGTVANNSELIKEGEIIIHNYLKKVLSSKYPEEITNSVFNYLIEEELMGHIGRYIGLKDIVLTTEFPVSNKTLSDTFKAVVAAIEKSQDLTQAEKFVKDFVLTQLADKNVIDIWNPKEPYEYLTKLLQEKGITSVEPRLCNQSATNTILACFQVGLYTNKNLLGIGWGESINIAKDVAALDAIQRIYKTNKIRLI